MKLLIVTQVVDKNHPILGFFHRWIEEFAKHFDEIHVICLEKGLCNLPEHVHVYSLGKEDEENKLKYFYRFYKYFGYVFLKKDIDYVFFHMGAVFNILAAPFFVLRKLYRTEFIWWKAHGKLNFEGKIASIFTDIVVTSTESGFPLKSKKKRVIGQAIDIELFTNDRRRKNKKILFTGRIMPVKQLEVFLSVAERLQDEGYSFTIVGPVGDEAYYAKLHALPGAKYVSFAGSMNQEQLVQQYQSADIFLNTSLTHSMDKTVLEAVLCGCVPITANKAFSDLLSKHRLYFEKQTVEAYVAKIIELDACNTDPLRHILRDEVLSHHSLATFTKRIFEKI